ncbi:MAG: hypothetical protein ABI743_07185 [bacterium]
MSAQPETPNTSTAPAAAAPAKPSTLFWVILAVGLILVGVTYFGGGGTP